MEVKCADEFGTHVPLLPTGVLHCLRMMLVEISEFKANTLRKSETVYVFDQVI